MKTVKTNAKTKKPLKLKDTESIASLFADDLVRYFRMGGDMQNLTAKKVYAKLRGSDEKMYSHEDLLADMEKSKEELSELIKEYPYFNDGKPSRETVDLMFDFDLTGDDHNYLLDKLDLPDNPTSWSTKQEAAYCNGAMKLRGIREEDRYLYLKFVYHNTNEEVDFEELFKDETDDNTEK